VKNLAGSDRQYRAHRLSSSCLQVPGWGGGVAWGGGGEGGGGGARTTQQGIEGLGGTCTCAIAAHSACQRRGLKLGEAGIASPACQSW
jgi:hypothetical protein